MLVDPADATREPHRASQRDEDGRRVRVFAKSGDARPGAGEDLSRWRRRASARRSSWSRRAGTGHFYTTVKNRQNTPGQARAQEVRSGGAQARRLQGDEAQVAAQPSRRALRRARGARRRNREMAWVITRLCRDCVDQACVEVCPVDCIYEYDGEDRETFPNQLFIDPEECINCGVCEPECPWEAIFEDEQVPEVFQPDIALNAQIVDAQGRFLGARGRGEGRSRRPSRSPRTRRSGATRADVRSRARLARRVEGRAPSPRAAPRARPGLELRGGLVHEHPLARRRRARRAARRRAAGACAAGRRRRRARPRPRGSSRPSTGETSRRAGRRCVVLTSTSCGSAAQLGERAGAVSAERVARARGALLRRAVQHAHAARRARAARRRPRAPCRRRRARPRARRRAASRARARAPRRASRCCDADQRAVAQHAPC